MILPRRHVMLLASMLPLAVGSAVAAPRRKSGTPEAVRIALTEDPRSDTAHPLRIEEVSILAKDGSRMSGVMTLAPGATPHPTVVLYHGYPGTADNRDLATAMARMGWNALTFHYRGLWGSGGSFSWGHAIEDARSALDFVVEPANLAKFGIDPTRIVVVGHSMGGFLALRTAARVSDRVKGVAVLSGANLGALGAMSRTPEGHQAVMQLAKTEAPVVGNTIEQLMGDLQRHQDEWDFLHDAAALRAMPVLVVEADDPLRAQNQELVQRLMAAGNRRVTERFIATDHSFTSGRIALATNVLTWLYGA